MDLAHAAGANARHDLEAFVDELPGAHGAIALSVRRTPHHPGSRERAGAPFALYFTAMALDVTSLTMTEIIRLQDLLSKELKRRFVLMARKNYQWMSNQAVLSQSSASAQAVNGLDSDWTSMQQTLATETKQTLNASIDLLIKSQ